MAENHKNDRMMKMEICKRVLPSLLIAIGLVVVGVCVKAGLNSLHSNRRYVDVRGLAEREVEADHVTWPIVYKITGNNLMSLYDKISESNDIVIKFLSENGISKDEITIPVPDIYDSEAQRYSSDDKGPRYIVTSVIVVSSQKVKEVNALIDRQTELLKEGISLSTDSYGYETTYEFTGLNEIKPEMIEEATENARIAGEKFAQDSKSKLGKIMSATQGQFSISDRDAYTPWFKEIRVVTYISYSIED